MGERSFSGGARAGIPFALASLIVGLSFGVLARPTLGAPAAIVMSIVVFAGSAQFAALAVLAAGGGALPAMRRECCSTSGSCRWESLSPHG